MGAGDGEANDERSRALDVAAALVTHAEDRQHKDEGDEDLHPEGLALVHALAQRRHAQIALLGLRRDALKHKQDPAIGVT